MAIKEESLVSHGVSACAGCSLELLIRVALDVYGENTVIVIPPGCAALFSGYGDESAVHIAGFQGNLGNTAAYAAGIKAGFEVQGRGDINVLGFAGDGATVDIGFQALSGAMERGDKINYICYDNEAYMNTGIQRSGSTPFKAKTTTTPTGKLTPRKDMAKIMVAHNIPYVASASAGYIKDYRKKVEKALSIDGPTYIHVHAPCPTGWSFQPCQTVDVARLAVETRSWLLYEVENGEYKITKKVNKPKHVKEYLQLQGRFSGVTEEDLEVIEKDLNRAYQLLMKEGEQ